MDWIDYKKQNQPSYKQEVLVLDRLKGERRAEVNSAFYSKRLKKIVCTFFDKENESYLPSVTHWKPYQPERLSEKTAKAEAIV